LPRAAIDEGLKDGTLDIAVMLVSNLEDRERIASETLFRSRRRLWLPVEHPLLQADTIDFADVSQAPYIMLTVDEAHQTAARYWGPTGLHPNWRERAEPSRTSSASPSTAVFETFSPSKSSRSKRALRLPLPRILYPTTRKQPKARRGRMN
jgi:DNA-binding transcriptional LysR family regulator